MLKINSYLLIVVIIAAFLRFVNIAAVPPSLNWDEVSHGYNAYSILTTGKDEWGVGYPAIFRAYGDYKLPVYIYLTAISEKAFGLNEFAVRLPSVLAGIGTVAVTYFLVLELFKRQTYLAKDGKIIAVLSALLVAVEPWSLFLSRGAFEANLSLFLVASGIYFFFKAVNSGGNLKLLPFSAICLGLSVWTYNSARVFVPVVLLFLAVVYFHRLKEILHTRSRFILISLFLILFFLIPMFIQLLQPIGKARYAKVAIIDSGAIAKINEARGSSKLPVFLNRAVNNKVTYFLNEFSKKWVSHYSLPFLFFEGGSGYQFSVPHRGVIYWINAVPLIIGLLWLLIKGSKEGAILLGWFILATIPSALTNEAPHVLRSILILPTPMIISSVGLWKIIGFLSSSKVRVNRTLIVAIYIFIISLFLENYMTVYFNSYKTNYSWSWQYGYKEAVGFVKTNYQKYDKIIISKKYGEAHEFLLFYWPWSAESYRNDPNLVRFFQSDWYWVDRFDKFYFVNDWQVPKNENDLWKLESGGTFDCQKYNCLLLTSPGNYPQGWKKLNTINFLNNKPAFDILDNSK